MALSGHIYDSLEPFTKYPILLSHHHKGSDTKFDLRPLCLRTDLQAVYDWQNSTTSFTNFHTNAEHQSALFFHKTILQSVNGQSLLILANNQPAALWAVTPAQFDAHLRKHEPNAQDKTLEFLMSRPNEMLLESSLSIIIQFCSLSKGSQRLFICIDTSLTNLASVLIRSGFQKKSYQSRRLHSDVSTCSGRLRNPFPGPSQGNA